MSRKDLSLLPSDYKKVARLGEGIGTVVWQVRHVATGEVFALKIDNEPDPSHRLQREFAILKRLDIPGIARVKGAGQHQGRDYFTMELVDGKPLSSFMVERRSEKSFVERFLEVFQHSLVILTDLHKQGIVHIDVKPSNFLVTEDGEPVLLDFGFAEDYVLSPTAEPSGTTLDYAAPELFTGGQVLPAADIYSMGAIAYEVLSGRKLWEGLSPRELIAVKLRTPPGLGKIEYDIPPGLEALVLRMLCPDPGLRPLAAEVLSEISWLTTGEKAVVSAPVMVSRLVFGGRDEETEELERLVLNEKKVVLLSGDSGMGKTRLLRELRFKALVDNRNVLYIEGRGMHLSLTEHLGSALGLDNTVNSGDKWSRYERVYQGVEKGGFDGVFIDAPLDLSEDEKGLLGYLSRGFDGKLGLILSQVPRDVHPNARELVLSSLDQVEVGALVSRTFEGLKEGDQLVQVLSSIAKGNPRRMNELLDILYSEGWLSWKWGWVYESRKDAEGLTQKLKDWLAESIAKLDKNSRVVLDMLALAEGALPGEVISDIVGEDAQRAIAGLVNAGLIRSFIYLNRPHYEFGNELVKSYLYAKLPSKVIKHLSRELIEALWILCRGIWGEDITLWEDDYLAQIAILHVKARDKVKIPGFMIVAVKRILSLGKLKQGKKILEEVLRYKLSPKDDKEILCELGNIATLEVNPENAENYYSKALLLVQGNPMEVASILVKIAKAYTQAKDTKRAEVFLNKSIECCDNPDSKLKLEQLNATGWIALLRNHLEEAQICFNKCLEIVMSPYEEIKMRDNLAWVLFDMGEYLKALEEAKTSLRIAEGLNRQDLICEIVGIIIHIKSHLENYDEWEEDCKRASSLAEEMQYPLLIRQIYDAKLNLLGVAGRFREALEVTRLGIELASKMSDHIKVIYYREREASLLILLGEFEEAQGLLRDLWRKYNSYIDKTDIPILALVDWATVLRALDKPKIAQRMLKKARVLAESIKDQVFSVDLPLLIELDYAGICLWLEDKKEAREAFERCTLLSSSDKSPDTEISLLLLETDILLLEGDVTRALSLASNATSYIENTFNTLGSYHASAYSLLGRVLVASGDYKKGLAKLRESLEITKSHEQPFEQGVALFEIAETMFKHEDYTEDAISALDEAETIFKRLGAQHNLKKVSELRAKYLKDWQTQVAPSLKNLEALSKVNELISKRLGKDGFTNELLDITLNLTKAQRGLIMVAESGEFYPIASKEMDPATSTDALRISETIMNQVVTEKCPIYTSDALLDERFSKAQSILINEIRSFICVPLKTDEQLAGTIYLDSKKTGLFKPDNMFYFETLGNLLAPSIKRTAEYKKLSEKLASRRGASDAGKKGIFLGSSHAIKKLQRDLVKIAGTDSNVLLEGETGSGKGVFARLIHMLSGRNEKEFCPINCGILPENIFETELFGTRKGAYTGAVEDRKGLLEASNCSTVFFDEITNTTLTLQAKLLEVIEDKVIRRVGENKRRQVDLRFIFATNRDLEEEVHQGRFREDLFFRINTITLKVPPLRDLREDLPEYVDFFLKESSRELGSEVRGIEKPALDRLVNYSWPGNVREMKNVIHRLVLMAHGSTITSELLDQHFAPVSSRGTKHLRRSREETLKERVHRALVVCEGNVTRAAKSMGVSRRHFYRLMERFKISKDNY